MAIISSISTTIQLNKSNYLALPFKYSLNETNSWRDVMQKMEFYEGASVTIPLKVDVLKNGVCEVVDDSALAIGAVNTLYKVDNVIHGTNTDWIGIKVCVEKKVTPLTESIPVDLPFVGIVLGSF
jgi:shikimate 5-dehydrogenase